MTRSETDRRINRREREEARTGDPSISLSGEPKSSALRALIYARVSKDDDGESRSVSDQEIECHRECERRGWVVDPAHVLREEAISASRHAKRTRPEWARVKRLIASRAVDVVVAWEASRATRELSEFLVLRDLCREAGVKLCWSGKVYDPAGADPDEDFMAVLSFALGERESDVTRKRILRRVALQAQEGAPHGRRLYGYTTTRDPVTEERRGRLVIPEERAVIREAATRVLGGETPNSVMRDLNARAIATPGGRAWNLRTLKRVLTNPGYAALRVHRGEVIGPASWEAILTLDEHRALVALYADPERARFATDGRTRPAHLLSGIAVCGRCGGRMYVGGDRGRPTYICRKSQDLGRDEAALDGLVTDLVLDRLAALAHRPPSKKKRAPVRDARTEVEREVADLRARLDDAVAEYGEGRLTAPTLAAVERDVLARVAEAEARVANAPQSSGAPVAVPPELLKTRGARRAWDRLDLAAKRGVVRALCSVTVLPSTLPRGSKRFNPDDVRVEWVSDESPQSFVA